MGLSVHLMLDHLIGIGMRCGCGDQSQSHVAVEPRIGSEVGLGFRIVFGLGWRGIHIRVRDIASIRIGSG